MIADFVLKSILHQIKDDADLQDGKVGISNYIPPDHAPPFIEVKIISHSQGVSYKTATAHVNVKVVSAYCGDQELQKIRSMIVKRLTHQPFKSPDQCKIIQGRLVQNDHKIENNGRIQIENLMFMFFMAPLH